MRTLYGTEPHDDRLAQPHLLMPEAVTKRRKGEKRRMEIAEREWLERESELILLLAYDSNRDSLELQQHAMKVLHSFSRLLGTGAKAL